MFRKLRDEFEAGVRSRVNDIVFNGDINKRLPHLSNISFRFIEGEGLLINLDMQGVAVSTGSACSSGSLEPSPVIRALGRNDELARGSIRFSSGRTIPPRMWLTFSKYYRARSRIFDACHRCFNNPFQIGQKARKRYLLLPDASCQLIS